MEYPSRSEIFCDKKQKNVSVDMVYADYFLGKGFIASMECSGIQATDEREKEV